MWLRNCFPKAKDILDCLNTNELPEENAVPQRLLVAIKIRSFSGLLLQCSTTGKACNILTQTITYENKNNYNNKLSLVTQRKSFFQGKASLLKTTGKNYSQY